ncbi:MAG: phosphotransacetylase family protein [Theionarchaea archaeon]|nr:phosphotransacetylase family protein [Theionarchaea archaeon]
MKTVFITSTSSCAGKSTIGLCAALNFPGKVGYFKPLTTNKDCILFRKVLNLEQEESELSLENGDLKSRFSALSENKDLMIVESGPNLSYGAYKGLSPSEIAKILDVEPVIVTAGSIETIVDKLIMGKGCFPRIRGVIINKVGYSDLNETTSFVIPSLEEVGFPVLGHIPSYKVLRMITARDVKEHLNAEVVCEEGMDKGIDTVLVGAMAFDAALTYFRRFADKVVVTGGDRAEIMLAAMETSTSCIVATGGVRPSPPVIKKAVELEIPILLVEGHTYAAAKEIETIRAEIRPDDHQKIELIKKMIARQIDLDAMLE